MRADDPAGERLPTRGPDPGDGNGTQPSGEADPGTLPEADRPRTLMEFRGTAAAAPSAPVDSEAPTLGPPTTPSAATAAGPFPRAIGPYEILSELGRGGMGIVYKAFHPGLKRTVALKVLIAGQDASEDAIARFHREAEAVAKLGHHPNIVPVYDIGQIAPEGAAHASPLHFIAMHYVEGKSLDRLIDEVGIAPRQAAVIARKIAEALRHAHGHGILHRDIKPANILMARMQTDAMRNPKSQVPHPNEIPNRKSQQMPLEGDANRRPSTLDLGLSTEAVYEPMLTDFGLAKDVQSDSRMTRSGMALGTPAYMPPEQADGRVRDIDARSDVYSLGATLYEMLASQPPFEGESVAGIIKKVLFDDPKPPRKANPAVDRDLETICLKCLEKEPARRYASAGELAADLDRYLRGEAIVARPASLAGKLLRKAGKHRFWVATGAAALLLATAGAVAGAFRVAQSERDKRAETGRARDSEDRAVTAEAERAREELRRRRSEKVAKVMMAAQARLFRTHSELKSAFYDAGKSPAERRALFDRHGKDIEDFFAPFLPAPPSASTGADPLASSQRAAALALKGWFLRLSGDGAGASTLFREAREADPQVGWGTSFEAMAHLAVYLADIEMPGCRTGPKGLEFDSMVPETPTMSAARDRFREVLNRLSQVTGGGRAVWGAEVSGDFEHALSGIQGLWSGRPAEAEAALSALLALPEFFWMEEELLDARTGIRYVLGDFEGGLADARTLLKRCPGWARARVRSAEHLLGSGLRASLKGEDPRKAYREALVDFDSALSLASGDSSAVVSRGNGWAFLAEAAEKAGEDALDAWAKALGDFEAALLLDSANNNAWNNRALARVSIGNARAGRGEDPRPEYRKALEELDEALRRWPDFKEARHTRYLAARSMAEAAAAAGEDPREALRRIIGDAEAILREQGGARDPSILESLARSWQLLGEAMEAGGEDPGEAFQQALRAADEALILQPESESARIGGGNAHQSLGKRMAAAGEDPGREYGSALEAYAEVLKRSPAHAWARYNRGLTYQYLGDWFARLGKDPRDPWGNAAEEYGEALKRNPGQADFWSNRAYALQSLGEEAARRGEDPSDLLRRAIEDYGASLERNPNKARTHHNRGMAHQSLGEADERVGRDPREAYRSAVRDLGTAVRLQPGWAPAWSNRGVAGHRLGNAMAARGENPAKVHETAVEDFAEAAELAASLWQARAGRGLLLGEMGRFEEAKAELEAAMRIAGDDATVSGWLAKARAEAALPAWRRALALAERRLEIGWHEGALESYEEGLRLGADAGAEADESARAIARNARYNLACVHSLCSAGRRGRLSPAEAPDPAQAAAHRRGAVENLRKAFELGWRDLDHVGKDTDLDPVRGTKEFRDLVEEWKNKAAGGK